MFASNSTLVFKVRRSEPELVRPAQPTPIEVKSLSAADDRMMHRHQMSFIQFYQATMDMKDKDPAKVIKTALAEALVFYYPWAGRLKEAPDGRFVVDCTAEGVGFLEADADVSLADFGEESLQPPFPCIQELVYHKATNITQIVGCPMFTMQVTRLLCGGFILTFTFNHIISDTRGVCQFVSAITDLARGAKTPSVLPVWQRELLPNVAPRAAPVVKDKSSNLLQPSPAAGSSDNNTMAPTTTYRSFIFGPQEVEALRSRLPAGGHLRDSCSTFDLITASVFRSRTIALGPRPEEEVRLRFIADARKKLVLPETYYGNSCVPVTVVCSAGEVCGSLAYLVEQLRKAKEEVTAEYARSIWNTTSHPPSPGPRPGPGPRPLPLPLDHIISDLSRAGLSSLDFGWGKPVYAGITDNGTNPHIVSFIVAFRNGRLVTVGLPADAMDRFSMALQALINPSDAVQPHDC